MGAAPKITPKRLQKSTNVRALQRRAIGVGLRAIESVSVDAAAEVALHFMFKQIRRFDRPSWEQQLLDRADDRFLLPWRDGHLAAWSWGDGPIVLLVHGWEGRGAQLGRFVEPLIAAGYRVVAFDGPAHGESTTTRGSMPDQLAAIERVAQHLGEVHAVIAHSMGGAAATIAAARGLDARFALLAPAGSPRDYFLAARHQVGFSRSTLWRLLDRAADTVGFGWDELDTPMRAIENEMPALIVHDEDDREVSIRHGEAIHSNWRGSRLYRTSGLGHRRILKDPSVVNAVVEFIVDADKSPTDD